MVLLVLYSRMLVAYWVRYSLILRMLYSAKRHDLETEAMWAVKVSWSLIMTPRFLAVLDGTRDKESVLILMLWWMTCVADHIASVSRSCRFALFNIRKIRLYLTQYATQLLVKTLVSFRLDYCNALLMGLPACRVKPLQTHA